MGVLGWVGVGRRRRKSLLTTGGGCSLLQGHMRSQLLIPSVMLLQTSPGRISPQSGRGGGRVFGATHGGMLAGPCVPEPLLTFQGSGPW